MPLYGGIDLHANNSVVSPRHQFIYTSADASRLCRNDRSPAISTQRLARVPRMFCLYPAYLLVELRFPQIQSA